MFLSYFNIISLKRLLGTTCSNNKKIYLIVHLSTVHWASRMGDLYTLPRVAGKD